MACQYQDVRTTFTALRNIKVSPGKSRKIPHFVTNPGKSTDSLTIQTRFHVEIRIVIFWIRYIYIFNSPESTSLSKTSPSRREDEIRQSFWETRRVKQKPIKLFLVSALLNKRTAHFWQKCSKSILSKRRSTNSANWNGCINKHAYFSFERVIWQLFPLKPLVFCENLKRPVSNADL